jgi:hypothetical protein
MIDVRGILGLEQGRNFRGEPWTVRFKDREQVTVGIFNDFCGPEFMPLLYAPRFLNFLEGVAKRTMTNIVQ